MNNKKLLLKVAFLCIALVLVLVILYSGLRILESTIFSKQQTDNTVATKVIERDGTRYFPRQDITVVMLIGINRSGVAEPSEPNHGYAADMVTLLIFDEQTQLCNILSLNRDTMLDMPRLNESGSVCGTFYGQLAYSHTFGTAMEDSCENTRTAVSDFLYGLNIDYYYAMNMDAISMLNDAVGGVTVTITDDFSKVDPTMTLGEITLKGEQAVHYVQARKNVGTQLNLSRMERQKIYMKGFVQALRAKMDESTTQMVRIYNDVAPYVVTDCNATIFSRLLEDYGDYTLGEVLSLPGENVLGEEHYEFYVDEAQLDETVLRLFYKEIG